MKLELLYFEGCPTYKAVQHTLQQVLLEEGIEAQVHLTLVNTNEEAQRLQFPGSPTVRLNGCDLFPSGAFGEGWGLGCRMYITPEGLRATPTAEMFREALLAPSLKPL